MVRGSLAALTAFLVAVFLAGSALAAEEGETPHYPLKKPRYFDWSFAGPLGHFDKQQLQRGFQVYREVCAACHSMSLLSFRNLGEEGALGYSEEQVKALAAEYTVIDEDPDEFGDPVERPARPADRFPSPWANENQARASNNGAYPPDMSVLAKARAVTRGFPNFLIDIFTQYQESGPDYVASLLAGYEEPPAGVEVGEGLYYNPYFIAGNALAMPPPLSDGLVSYAQNQDEDPGNDVPETVEQYSKDVTAFMAWSADPKLEQRKAAGFGVMVFLIIFAGLLYYTKRTVWDGEAH